MIAGELMTVVVTKHHVTAAGATISNYIIALVA